MAEFGPLAHSFGSHQSFHSQSSVEGSQRGPCSQRSSIGSEGHRSGKPRVGLPIELADRRSLSSSRSQPELPRNSAPAASIVTEPDLYSRVSRLEDLIDHETQLRTDAFSNIDAQIAKTVRSALTEHSQAFSDTLANETRQRHDEQSAFREKLEAIKDAVRQVTTALDERFQQFRLEVKARERIMQETLNDRLAVPVPNSGDLRAERESMAQLIRESAAQLREEMDLRDNRICSKWGQEMDMKVSSLQAQNREQHMRRDTDLGNLRVAVESIKMTNGSVHAASAPVPDDQRISRLIHNAVDAKLDIFQANLSQEREQREAQITQFKNMFISNDAQIQHAVETKLVAMMDDRLATAQALVHKDQSGVMAVAKQAADAAGEAMNSCMQLASRVKAAGDAPLCSLIQVEGLLSDRLDAMRVEWHAELEGERVRNSDRAQSFGRAYGVELESSVVSRTLTEAKAEAQQVRMDMDNLCNNIKLEVSALAEKVGGIEINGSRAPIAGDDIDKLRLRLAKLETEHSLASTGSRGQKDELDKRLLRIEQEVSEHCAKAETSFNLSEIEQKSLRQELSKLRSNVADLTANAATEEPGTSRPRAPAASPERDTRAPGIGNMMWRVQELQREIEVVESRLKSQTQGLALRVDSTRAEIMRSMMPINSAVDVLQERMNVAEARLDQPSSFSSASQIDEEARKGRAASNDHEELAERVGVLEERLVGGQASLESKFLRVERSTLERQKAMERSLASITGDVRSQAVSLQKVQQRLSTEFVERDARQQQFSEALMQKLHGLVQKLDSTCVEGITTTADQLTLLLSDHAAAGRKDEDIRDTDSIGSTHASHRSLSSYRNLLRSPTSLLTKSQPSLPKGAAAIFTNNGGLTVVDDDDFSGQRSASSSSAHNTANRVDSALVPDAIGSGRSDPFQGDDAQARGASREPRLASWSGDPNCLNPSSVMFPSSSPVSSPMVQPARSPSPTMAVSPTTLDRCQSPTAFTKPASSAGSLATPAAGQRGAIRQASPPPAGGRHSPPFTQPLASTGDGSAFQDRPHAQVPVVSSRMGHSVMHPVQGPQRPRVSPPPSGTRFPPNGPPVRPLPAPSTFIGRGSIGSPGGSRGSLGPRGSPGPCS